MERLANESPTDPGPQPAPSPVLPSGAGSQATADGHRIWKRIGERIEGHLSVVERHAHVLLDRPLTDHEVGQAGDAAAQLARECGEMELPALAQLARHIESTLGSEGLNAVHAVQIAGTSEDIRSVYASAVGQQESRVQTRGTMAIVGTATHAVDRIAWILATRGHGVIQLRDQIPAGLERPSGVILTFPDGLTPTGRALLRVVGETWSVPTVALYDAPDAETLRTLAASCSSILPLDASADLISSELQRIDAAALATPVVFAHGRVPRPAQDRLRAHGFKIRRARTTDDLPRLLHEGHAAVLFGQTVDPADVIATTRVIRAMPRIRRSVAIWLTDEPGDARERAHRMGVLVVESITDAVAAHASAVVRRDVAAQANEDAAAAPVLDWSIARVLADRALVAAYRAADTLAVAVVSISPELDESRVTEIHDLLGREFRRGDIVGLQNDHTLIVLLRGVTPRVAKKRLEELIERLDIIDATDGIGIAMFPADGGSADELVGAAHAVSLLAQATSGPKVVDATWRAQGTGALDVLLVESDAVFGRMLAAMIGTKGYTVELLDSGDAAFEHLISPATARPGVLAVDLDTSGLDGISLIRRLRQRGSLSGSKILLMTSRSSESDLRVALDLGVTDVIRKPFSGTLMLHRIERILGES